MPSDSTPPRPDASDRPSSDAGGFRLLLVELGETICGMDADQVREIVAMLPATRLPGAPAYVKGVVNLRGQLLTVMDLAERMTGQPVRDPEGSTVVVQVGERSLGLLVDDVRDVQRLQVLPSDEGTVTDAAGLVTGLGRLDDEVVLVIDVPELVRQILA